MRQTQIKLFLFSSRYKENAVRVSKLLRDRQRTPAEEGADWIEYVLRHNSSVGHLRFAVTRMSWYDYWFDVMASLLIGALIIALVFLKIYS